MPGSEPDTAQALVFYGETRLFEEYDAVDFLLVEQLLDSLCSLEEGPEEMIRHLRLYRRIRTMDDRGIAAMIDSLFDLDEIPYALINEINLHIQEMPELADVNKSVLLEWACSHIEPCGDLYGAWNTLNPNAYGPELSAMDSLVLMELVRPSEGCGFHMPVPGPITSRYGWRDGRNHNGIDVDLEVGDPVRSSFPGVVRYAGTFGSFGRLVVVRHLNGLETFYAHLHRLRVKAGDVVDAGDLLGLGGSSGRSSGSHLHFEVRFKGMPIDPARVIDLETRTLHHEVVVLKRTRAGFSAFPRGTEFHTVARGEHLRHIADLYGVSVKAICEANGLSTRSTLREGQQLAVAGPSF
ncbi:MAG: peptidoglycan DD-metalloendopeptidase family protein [Flavobacteriales bacterium]|nr:peptidoglycan DD-metalloendopeptidase family protein [Flavobacteriales bacterium]